ncbi:unnamed protein product, partial [Ectocarpus sp. 12 AP-2014]
ANRCYYLVWILGVWCWIHEHRTRLLYGPVALFAEEAAKFSRLWQQRCIVQHRRKHDPRKLPHVPPRQLLRGATSIILIVIWLLAPVRTAMGPQNYRH